jgi:hypothetical protein
MPAVVHQDDSAELTPCDSAIHPISAIGHDAIDRDIKDQLAMWNYTEDEIMEAQEEVVDKSDIMAITMAIEDKRASISMDEVMDNSDTVAIEDSQSLLLDGGVNSALTKYTRISSLYHVNDSDVMFSDDADIKMVENDSGRYKMQFVVENQQVVVHQDPRIKYCGSLETVEMEDAISTPYDSDEDEISE